MTPSKCSSNRAWLMITCGNSDELVVGVPLFPTECAIRRGISGTGRQNDSSLTQ